MKIFNKWNNFLTKDERNVILLIGAIISLGIIIRIILPTSAVIESEGKFSVKTAPQKEQKKSIEFPININTASMDELIALPGIGKVYAKRIIQFREKNGGFKTKKEIIKIKGIGEKRFEKLKDLIIVKYENRD